MKLGGKLIEPERLIPKGVCMSVSWKPAGFVLLTVAFAVKSWEFSAQPINVAGEPETSSGSICLAAVNCHPGVAVIPTKLLEVDPLLDEEELAPDNKDTSGLTDDPLQGLSLIHI